LILDVLDGKLDRPGRVTIRPDLILRQTSR
jgi:LacI family gluconate utilization system Gnt-I transcriptional repressor